MSVVEQFTRSSAEKCDATRFSRPQACSFVGHSFDLRFEHAKEDFTRIAVQAAVITALLAFAAIAGAMAVGVALTALYQWTAEEAGLYAGLGAVRAVLIVAAIILPIAATEPDRQYRFREAMKEYHNAISG